MQENSANYDKIILQLCLHYGVNTQAQLVERLGLKPSVFSGWKTRHCLLRMLKKHLADDAPAFAIVEGCELPQEARGAANKPTSPPPPTESTLDTTSRLIGRLEGRIEEQEKTIAVLREELALMRQQMEKALRACEHTGHEQRGAIRRTTAAADTG